MSRTQSFHFWHMVVAAALLHASLLYFGTSIQHGNQQNALSIEPKNHIEIQWFHISNQVEESQSGAQNERQLHSISKQNEQSAGHPVERQVVAKASSALPLKLSEGATNPARPSHEIHQISGAENSVVYGATPLNLQSSEGGTPPKNLNNAEPSNKQKVGDGSLGIEGIDRPFGAPWKPRHDVMLYDRVHGQRRGKDEFDQKFQEEFRRASAESALNTTGGRTSVVASFVRQLAQQDERIHVGKSRIRFRIDAQGLVTEAYAKAIRGDLFAWNQIANKLKGTVWKHLKLGSGLYVEVDVEVRYELPAGTPGPVQIQDGKLQAEFDLSNIGAKRQRKARARITAESPL